MNWLPYPQNEPADEEWVLTAKVIRYGNAPWKWHINYAQYRNRNRNGGFFCSDSLGWGRIDEPDFFASVDLPKFIIKPVHQKEQKTCKIGCSFGADL